MKKEIRYLGEVTWNEAIDKAVSLGMFIPNQTLMREIVKVLEPTLKSMYITSTVFAYDTSKFVFPVDKPIKELQRPEAVENGSRSIKRKAYAVHEDFTVNDIHTGNYYFTKIED